MFDKLSKANIRVGFFGGIETASFEFKDDSVAGGVRKIDGFYCYYYNLVPDGKGCGFYLEGKYFVSVDKFKQIFGDVAASQILWRDCVVGVNVNSAGKKNIKAVAFL